ncbi:hypothetical protein [Spirosoma oryzicola]|uniref:hypothetical protein n=1 Tax=Spirosoma oryzicola TaxID=2898794 RepID=UPI001E453051|nr:hypothetical protein [Spirosoma oryzicola]UHG93298.1 hypothetical protein LQ777_10435 [Spirosoma oryzicola]
METTHKFQSAARLLVADLWEYLPGETNHANWQDLFKRELAQLAQDHSYNRYTGYKLIRWVRCRARRLYDMYFKQDWHEQAYRIHFIDKLSSAMLSVTPYTPEEGQLLIGYSRFTHNAWLLTDLLPN